MLSLSAFAFCHGNKYEYTGNYYSPAADCLCIRIICTYNDIIFISRVIQAASCAIFHRFKFDSNSLYRDGTLFVHKVLIWPSFSFISHSFWFPFCAAQSLPRLTSRHHPGLLWYSPFPARLTSFTGLCCLPFRVTIPGYQGSLSLIMQRSSVFLVPPLWSCKDFTFTMLISGSLLLQRFLLPYLPRVQHEATACNQEVNTGPHHYAVTQPVNCIIYFITLFWPHNNQPSAHMKHKSVDRLQDNEQSMTLPDSQTDLPVS